MILTTRVEQLGAALCGAAVLAGGAPAIARNEQTPAALRGALIEAYPSVTRWEITRLRGAGAGDAAVPVQRVLRVGARSAVRSSDGTTTWYLVRGWVPGLVANRDLPPQGPTDSRDWSPSPVDLLSARCAPLASFPIGPSWRTRSETVQGSPLNQCSLQAMPMIRRGETVSLRSQVRGVSVISEGLALTDAARGDGIAVRALGSGRVVHGRVAQSSEVQVDVLH